MKKRNTPSKVFFGWWTVMASGILTFWGQGFVGFGFSALFKPMSSQLGFSRASTSVAPSIVQVERGLLSPIVGLVADRYGPRWMVFPGVFVLGAGLVLMNFVNSLWSFYLVWGVLVGIGTNMAVGLALDKTVANWFVKKRGRALGIKYTLHAFSAVLMLPLVAWLITARNWQMTCVIAGVVMLIIGPPLAWFFVKQHRPEYYGLLPDGAVIGGSGDTDNTIDMGVEYAIEAEEIEFTLKQAMRTPAYWLILLANATLSFVPPVLNIHGVPFLTDMGIEAVQAAVMIGAMSSSSIPGTFVSGFIADRVKKKSLRFLMGGLFCIGIIGFTPILVSQTVPMVYPLFILLNFVGGAYNPLNNVIIARYFGRKAFGSIRGTLMIFMLPAAVVAPIYAGWVYDTTLSYITVFYICAVLLAFSAVFMSLASPPKAPAHGSDIRQLI